MQDKVQLTNNFPQILAGKTGLIMGVVNDMSIAWAIAEMASKCGADLVFTYQSDALLKRVEPLAKSVNSNVMVQCDVSSQDSIDSAFAQIEKSVKKIDFVIHAIAFSDKNELRGRYVDTSKQNFLNTMDISCYSLAAVTQRAEKLMDGGGSILTLTYYGAEKVIPNYNVMGVAKAALECSVKYLAADLGEKNIRVNAISAGPIKTLAASGIGGFRNFLKVGEKVNPLRRNTSLEDVAGTALFLASDLSAGITGENIHVDCGYNVIGMQMNPDEAA